MTRHLVIIVFSLAVFTTPVCAQTFKDGPHVGFLLGGDTDEPDTAFGWQAAYEFDDTFSLELTVTRIQDDIEGSEFNVPPFPDRGGIELETWEVALTGRAGILLDEKLYMYAGAGAGYYFFAEEAERIREGLAADAIPGASGGTVTDVGVDIDDDFGFHLTVGLEYLIKEAWEFFAEVRFSNLEADTTVRVVESLPTDDFGKSKSTTSQSGKFNYDHTLLRLGVNYRF